MMGRLLSVETMEANDPDFLVAQKIMDDNSKTTIFLGNLYVVSMLKLVWSKYLNSQKTISQYLHIIRNRQ